MKKKWYLLLTTSSLVLPLAMVSCGNTQEPTKPVEPAPVSPAPAPVQPNPAPINPNPGNGNSTGQVPADPNPPEKVDNPNQNNTQTNTPPNKGNNTTQNPNQELNDVDQTRLDYFVNYDNAQRFDFDNKFVVDQLRQINEVHRNNQQIQQAQRDVLQLQHNLDTNQSYKDKYDDLAKRLGLDNFDNSRYKSFTIPSYNESGLINGLNIQKKVVIPPSDIENLLVGANKAHGKGLGRTLTHEKYKDVALETFAITIDNSGNNSANPNDPYAGRQYSGTAWILDYELSEDGKYPTKWYLASNLHVVSYLGQDTKTFWIGRVDEDTPLNQTISTKDRLESEKDSQGVFNQWFTKFKIDLTKPELRNKIKLVYTGVDFLKKDPKDFLSQKQQSEFAEYKEYADLAVFEIDFSNVNDKSALAIYSPKPNSNAFLNTEDFLKRLTNNYATKTEDKQTTFLKDSYLKNYEPIDTPLANNNASTANSKDYLLALGYPSNFGHGIPIPQNQANNPQAAQKYIEETYNIDLGQMNLWTNNVAKDPSYLLIDKVTSYDSLTKIPEIVGNRLTNHVSVTTFKDKSGVFDSFLTWPLVNNIEAPLTVTYNNKSTKLIQMGLGYALANYEAPGGASGSSVRNQKNELVGIFHSIANNTLFGMAAAFRSEGFNYQGLFGDYNLPQYDLIYGGGKDQQNSYKESLAKLYPNIKTRLFKNGVSAEYPEFKFNN